MHVIIDSDFKRQKCLSPPSVINKGTKCAWYLDRTLANCLKLATLLRVRNSSSLSLRSREWTISTRCCRCDHMITPTVGLASSLTKASLESMTSSSWALFTVSVRIWAASKGRMSPYSAPISVINKKWLTYSLNCFHYCNTSNLLWYADSIGKTPEINWVVVWLCSWHKNCSFRRRSSQSMS